jgi:cytochrome c-type biogenesis protein CcmE
MNPTRRRRLWMVSLVLAGAAIATTLTLAALNQNLQHFYSPSDVRAGMAPKQQTFRLGGIVEEGSLKRATDSLKVEFTVTDRFQTMPVRYEGILPDLFKEGQSVVTTGSLQPDGAFAAREVLAKHDENYMPKEVADAIARAKTKQAQGTP